MPSNSSKMYSQFMNSASAEKSVSQVKKGAKSQRREVERGNSERVHQHFSGDGYLMYTTVAVSILDF
jgi:hypothetical protein